MTKEPLAKIEEMGFSVLHLSIRCICIWGHTTFNDIYQTSLKSDLVNLFTYLWFYLTGALNGFIKMSHFQTGIFCSNLRQKHLELQFVILPTPVMFTSIFRKVLSFF